ncbi:hypothetical protein [Vibrio crassostreae]|uniref:hypothetical protein n=1 Tax=Vibrio crassostreae TaxID=246167 RepID=UPI001B315BDD|nr:hypothetical protein [Vibrio crassostreae]
MFISPESSSILTYLDKSGAELNPDWLLHTNEDYIEETEVVTSDNRMVTIIGVSRITLSNEATGGSSRSTVTTEFYPTSEPIDGLYENVALAKKIFDEWKYSFTQKGKKPPKLREQIVGGIIYGMVADVELYEEVVSDGVAEYLATNLK